MARTLTVKHARIIRDRPIDQEQQQRLLVERRRAAQPVLTTYLRLDEIDESAESRNSRRTYDETRLAELAASIHEHGVLQPILVTPAAERFRVICGNRRLKAARQAGLTEIPAIVRDHVDDHTVFLWNLVENIQRVDLSTKERVAAICELAQFGLGIREISRGTGLAPSTISKWIRLADKPTVMRALEEGHLDIFRAMHLAPITDPEQLERLLAIAPSVNDKELAGLVKSVSDRNTYCIDDGRLADVDRKLALVHMVTPVGLAHLQRIAVTVAALLKQAQAVPVSADPSAVVGRDEVFLSETPADASQPSVTTSVRDAKSGALAAKEHGAPRHGRGTSRPSGRRASPLV